ncbi:MAG TPA: GtrA family protein [Candidatus Saccharimonadales bacterium]|nr:GtrA family protein [Candidatus Saccharimonadales bacterium]
MGLLIMGKTPVQFVKALFVNPTSRGRVQLVRYGMVAIVAFVVDFGLLFVFGGIFEWNYLISTTLAFSLSVIVNYYLSTLWVFARRNRRQRHLEIAIFIAICFVALLLNNLFMWVFTSLADIHYLISKLITVMLVFIWSFGARRIMFHGDLAKNTLIKKIANVIG